MRKRLVGAGLLGAVLALGGPAEAEVTRIDLRVREPYENGRAFGTVGSYQRLAGRVHFEVDPKLEANRRVIDLELAPRNGRGRVEFSADLEILAPKDLSRANGTALYDVNNRGNRTAEGMFNGGADGFLMRNGYILVRSGWIAELLPDPRRLRLEVPVAFRNGAPIRGRVRAEMAPDAPAERLNIAQWAGHGSYAPTPRGVETATLTWRLREADARVPIPRNQWRLEARPIEVNGEKSALPQVDLVLAGGFRPGYLYELIYEAEGPLVQGLGLAGIRDLIAFLKYERGSANPVSLAGGDPAVKRAIGFGVSQSGRALRQLLYDGFNADERGRIVFDGLIPHVAGAGMGFFNHRFASPTRHNAQHDNHLYPADVFPFTYGEEKDPFTGRTDGLLRRARAAGVVPKIFHTQTSAEYWHRSGSLVHTDPRGKRDAVIPPEVRIYAIGGAQHGAGSGIPGAKGNGLLPGNPTDYRPLLRGLLTSLHAWITDGTLPPDSRYPRIADGTLAGWREGESGWQALPGVRYPEVIHNPEYLDHGPEFRSHRRLTRLPPVRKGRYTVLVPRYGPDNNEQGVLSLPTVAVPLGTLTGWNLRDPKIGAEHELLSLTGAYIPLLRTPEERKAAGDPRPSLQERYPSRENYLQQFHAATRRLVRERYLLEVDVPRLNDLGRRLWDGE